jgi:hypothetical protein
MKAYCKKFLRKESLGMMNLRDIKSLLGRFHLLVVVLPLTVLVGVLKAGFHCFGWEFLPLSTMPFITSILTGIILFFGFILAGIISDYKESERLPGEIVTSLYTIWREARNLSAERTNTEITDKVEKKYAHSLIISTLIFLYEKKTEFSI